VRGRPAGPEWSRYRETVAAGLAGAGLVAAPTRAMLQALVRHYEFATETAVVPNGLSSPAPAGPKERLVAGVGRFWDEAKNLAALDRAAARLDVPVLLAGETGIEHPQHAHALGRVADVRPLLARCGVFASPARYEPFGLAALEAALAGCALVLGDIPSLREVWDDAALYVEPDDDEALAAAVELALDMPDLGVRARDRACRYTPGRMAAGYLDLYERLLSPEPALAAPADTVERVA
jgi:glycosyltransferase involved in cell wall biosynthesis